MNIPTMLGGECKIFTKQSEHFHTLPTLKYITEKGNKHKDNVQVVCECIKLLMVKCQLLIYMSSAIHFMLYLNSL